MKKNDFETFIDAYNVQRVKIQKKNIRKEPWLKFLSLPLSAVNTTGLPHCTGAPAEGTCCGSFLLPCPERNWVGGEEAAMAAGPAEGTEMGFRVRESCRSQGLQDQLWCSR